MGDRRSCNDAPLPVAHGLRCYRHEAAGGLFMFENAELFARV